MASSSAAPAAQWKTKVCLVGGTGVGKTSLIRRFVQDQFDDRYLITLGTKVSKRVVDLEFPSAGRIRVDLTLWDTMGEEFLRPTLYDTVLGGARGVLVVCDVSDPTSILPAISWIDLARRLRGDVPVQILLNKSDLGHSSEVVAKALDLGRKQHAPCYLTSAKTGDNVISAFEDVARRIAAMTFAERNPELDPLSENLISQAASSPKGLQDFVVSTRLSSAAVQSHVELLVRQGRLRAMSIDIGPDGRPLMKYIAGGGPIAAESSHPGVARRSSGDL